MGEAFKRKRAHRFQHQSHAASQQLFRQTLFTLARGRLASRELLAQALDLSELPPIGSQCLVRANDNGVIHGTNVVGELAEEAAQIVAACAAEASTLGGALPFRVKNHGPFGGFELVLDICESSNE